MAAKKVSNAPEIGRRLKELRLGRGWTQPELARRSGVTQPQISRVEKGDRGVMPDALVDLAAALDTPFIYLLRGHGPKSLRSEPPPSLAEAFRKRPGYREFTRTVGILRWEEMRIDYPPEVWLDFLDAVESRLRDLPETDRFPARAAAIRRIEASGTIDEVTSAAIRRVRTNAAYEVTEAVEVFANADVDFWEREIARVRLELAQKEQRGRQDDRLLKREGERQDKRRAARVAKKRSAAARRHAPKKSAG